jgi:hypothetical protein
VTWAWHRSLQCEHVLTRSTVRQRDEDIAIQTTFINGGSTTIMVGGETVTAFAAVATTDTTMTDDEYASMASPTTTPVPGGVEYMTDVEDFIAALEDRYRRRAGHEVIKDFFARVFCWDEEGSDEDAANEKVSAQSQETQPPPPSSIPPYNTLHEYRFFFTGPYEKLERL